MTQSTNKPNIGFWMIGAIALLWNLMGVSQYLMQAYKTEAWKAQYSAEQLEMFANLPSWYTAVFAIAVFASTIACILLLLRKKAAISAFLIGLIAVLIQTGYNIFINEASKDYGGFEYAMLIMIPFVAALLWWYSKICDQKGLLR